MGRFLETADRLAHYGMKARGLSTRFVEAGGARVHVYEGRGRGTLPPVVPVHGLGAAGPAFARMIPRFLPHVKRVIVPELPGHGRSPHPGERVTPDFLLDAMTGALDAVIDEPAIVCGNSLGGAVSLAYATRRPEHVSKLVLVSPAGARLEADEWRELVAAFDVHDRRTAKRFLERIYHRPPWFLALVAHEFPDVVRREAVRDVLETATPEGGALESDLASLRMPILLVWGRSDRLLPRAALDWFRAHLPPQTIVEESEAFGHSPQLEQPKRIADRILRFAREAR